MEEVAFAKLNLALHVRGLEEDGYHRIETIFAFCEDGDLLSVREGGELSLTVTGPFAAAVGGGEDNLVLRAARALAGLCGSRKGANFILDKRLPVAAGLGGGSADAAAALRLLCRWWNVAPDEPMLCAHAAELGADVPACLASRTARGEGRGDQLAPWPGETFAGAPVLLVNPGVPLATAEVFRAWDGVDRGALDGLEGSRNDLEPAALALVPEIGTVLAALAGAGLSRMSGSGATCFGVYTTVDERDAAAERIGARHPRWWRLATRLR